MITFVLILMAIVLLFLILQLKRNMVSFALICRIAECRRKLIDFVDRKVIDVNSELFKFSYGTVELLLRIRYFKLHFLLPDTKNLFNVQEIRKGEERNHKSMEKEIMHIKNTEHGREFISFYSDFIMTMYIALIKNVHYYRFRCIYRLTIKIFKFNFNNNGLLTSMVKISRNTNEIGQMVSENQVA